MPDNTCTTPVGYDNRNRSITEGDRISHIREGRCGTIECGMIVFPNGEKHDAAGYIKMNQEHLRIKFSETHCINEQCLPADNCASC